MKTYLALNGMTRYVQVGDVIYIEATSGAVKRVGRSDAHATEFDLEAEEYVPLPKGDVHKKKEVVQVGGWAPRTGLWGLHAGNTLVAVGLACWPAG